MDYEEDQKENSFMRIIVKRAEPLIMLLTLMGLSPSQVQLKLNEQSFKFVQIKNGGEFLMVALLNGSAYSMEENAAENTEYIGGMGSPTFSL